MKTNITKIAVATLSAIALTSQLAAIPQTAVKAESDFAEVVTVREVAVAQEFTQDKYTKSQVEFLISQIVANNSDTDDYDEVSYTYSDLYYSPSDKAGYVIDFTYGDSCGYIVMLVDDDSSKPAEIVLDRQSPYYGKAGTYLYPAQGSYYVLADNGNVVEAMQYTVMSDKPQNVVMMNSKGKDDRTPYKRTYYYDYIVSRNEYAISNFCCDYKTNYRDGVDKLVGHEPQPNNCANIAGVIALNYFNKCNNNELLNLAEEDFFPDSNNMNYRVAYSYADTFFRYMKTNNWFNDYDTVWGSIFDTFAPNQYGGTLPANCYAGFERLIREKGFRTRKEILSTYDDIKFYINMRTPVFITAMDYRMGDIFDSEYKNELEFDGFYITGIEKAHTFVAYGYKELTIHEGDGKLTTLNYFQVANGWGGTQYFIMDESNVISAAAIDVYNPILYGC